MSDMNMSNCLVTVIMAAYHEAPILLQQAIDSILDQSYSNLEFIILLDDPDNAELNSLISRYARSDKRIRYERNESNIGLAQCLNRGISLAHGEYICRMDADDISCRDRILTQLHYLSDNNLDLVGGFTDVINENGELLYGVDNLPITPSAISKGLLYNNCVPHPTWFGRKDTFEAGYRSIPLCEDYDFLIRSALHGKRIGNCPIKVLKYRMTSGSLSRSGLYKQFLFQQALTRAYKKGNMLSLEDGISYVDQYFSPEKSLKYARANQEFNQGLSCLRNREYLGAISHLLRVPLLSKAYMSKIYRLVRVATLYTA